MATPTEAQLEWATKHAEELILNAMERPMRYDLHENGELQSGWP